jgi:TRAP transporter TAXI family solute receptor
LVLSARTSEGSVDNVLAVNRGTMDSGFAQSDVVADAVAGRGAFRRAGAQKNIRVIASLFSEKIYLVVSPKSRINSVADLRGKRVALGASGSGTAATARAILAAYGISERRLKLRNLSGDAAAQGMEAGKLDAFFFVGGTPVALIADWTRRGKARLVPIDGAGRTKLVKRVPGLVGDEIPAGPYGLAKPVQTVSTRAIWIVRANASDDIVYGITRMLFASRGSLSGGPAGEISLSRATSDLPAALHPGALRFYRENNLLRRGIPRAGSAHAKT